MKMVLDSNIKEYEIEDGNGALLHVLRIDTSDATTPQRFGRLVANLNHLSDDYESEIKATLKDDERDFDTVVKASVINTKYLEKCASEIDACFGAGTIRGIFSKNFEINPEYVPDEIALLQFVENVMPIMEELFKTRFAKGREKYNVHRKGAHNKTKDELIAEYKASRE